MCPEGCEIFEGCGKKDNPRDKNVPSACALKRFCVLLIEEVCNGKSIFNILSKTSRIPSRKMLIEAEEHAYRRDS